MRHFLEGFKAKEALFLIRDMLKLNSGRTAIRFFEVVMYILDGVTFRIKGAASTIIHLIPVKTIIFVELPMFHL